MYCTVPLRFPRRARKVGEIHSASVTWDPEVQTGTSGLAGLAVVILDHHPIEIPGRTGSGHTVETKHLPNSLTLHAG